MTAIGKIFVFLQFMVATALLAVGFGLYVNHTNWDAAIKDEAKRINELSAHRDRAMARYAYYTQKLERYEQARPLHLARYEQKLTLARNGDPMGGVAVTEVEYGPVQPNGGPLGFVNVVGSKPVQYRGENVMAYVPLEAEMQRHNMRRENPNGQVMLGLIPTEQERIKTLLDQYTRLTAEINGDGGALRGLRRERELQEEARAKALGEIEFLKPTLANRYGEAVLLLKRQNSLTARKAELGRQGVAATAPADGRAARQD